MRHRLNRILLAVTAAAVFAGCTPAEMQQWVRAHPAPSSSSGCDAARAALVRQGGTAYEVNLGVRIAKRESLCRLGVHNYNRRTHDDSWGPFQVNYWGNLRGGRTALLGPPATNTSSWDRAAANFLKLGRTAGWCHWNPPRYCAGR